MLLRKRDSSRRFPRAIAWCTAVVVVSAVHLTNALRGPLLVGYDSWGHVAYVLFLELFHALPWGDQGWSYFHPPLHYGLGWGLLQVGNAEFMLRGLAVWGGIASIGIALLAAHCTRRAMPERPYFALLSFVSVASLPVFLYSAPMSGNELTAQLFGALALGTHVTNQCRRPPSRAIDGLTGVFIGAMLLTKFSGLTLLVTVAASITLHELIHQRSATAARRCLGRIVTVAAVALVLAAPYYQRNLQEFGTPFRMSRNDPLVAGIEHGQAPGVRTWRDFVQMSPRLFVDQRPDAPHLARSVWGSTYVSFWIDNRREWARVGDAGYARIEAARDWMVGLGLLPTLFALLGAILALRDVCSGRRRAVYIPLLVACVANLAAYAGFAVRVPLTSALKASYLLGLALPYGAFVARGIEAMQPIGPRATRIAVAALTGVALASAAVNTSGLILPRLSSHFVFAATAFLTGELDAARHFYASAHAAEPASWIWREDLAAVELVSGNAERAMELYAQARPPTGRAPYRWNNLAVAAALTGDLVTARSAIEQGLRVEEKPALLVNLGILQALAGEHANGEATLRKALEYEAHLAPAWNGLRWVLQRSEREGEATQAAVEARRSADTAPRGWPYGLGEAVGQRPTANLGPRWMLWPRADGLRLARAPFRDEDAVAMNPESHP